jgi:uncharacterized protein (DUF927 family)
VNEGEKPVTDAEKPVNEVEKPVTEAEKPVTEVKKEFRAPLAKSPRRAGRKAPAAGGDDAADVAAPMVDAERADAGANDQATTKPGCARDAADAEGVSGAANTEHAPMSAASEMARGKKGRGKKAYGKGVRGTTSKRRNAPRGAARKKRAAGNGQDTSNQNIEAEEATIARLATMSLPEYDKVRKAEAKRLGFSRIGVFEALVQGVREKVAAVTAVAASTETGTEESNSGDATASGSSGFTVTSEPEGGAPVPNWPARMPDTNGAILPEGFEMKASGLWYQPRTRGEGEAPDPIWVSAPFEVLAETNDDTDHNHGLLLCWSSRAGGKHQWAMPQRMVHADGNAIASELHDAGLPCGTSRTAHDQLKHFMGAVRSVHRVRCVERAGWHGDAYVLPNGRIFGAGNCSRLVLQSEHAATAGSCVAHGTLEEWQQHIASRAVGNDLLMFTVSAAFAGSLLDVMGETSGGVHIFGGSQTGKTTAMCAAASVWGPGDNRTGPIRSWRVTANGLEAVAAEHSDGILILDETAQVSAREVGEVVYMLANQRGKARMSRSAGARRVPNWRLMYLSTGETDLATKMGEAGLRPHAGQDVRLLGLSADVGAGLGVFQNTHGSASPGTFADQLRRAAVSSCGTAGPALLEALVHDRVKDPERLQGTLRKGREKFLTSNVSDGADGQVRSAAARFGLIGLAGELARAYGVVRWAEGDAIRAAEWCFRSWLAARGGAGPAEDKQALSMVAAFIALHGSARFERLSDDGKVDPPEQRVVNRAGYVRGAGQEQEFMILAPVWHGEVCKGIDPSRAARTLQEAGFLVPDKDDRRTQRPRIPGRGQARVYVIRSSILG